MAPAKDSERGETVEHHLIDRFLKALLPHLHTELVTWLVGERPLEVRALNTTLATVEERAGDQVLWARFAARPSLLLHLEFYLQGRVDVPERVTQYIALEVRTKEFKESGARLACIVVYLDEGAYRHDPGFFEVQGELGTRLRAEYRVVKLWEEDPRALLGLENPGLCVFGPLLRGDTKELCVQSGRRIQSSGLPGGLKRDLLAMLSVLAARKLSDRAFLRRFLLEIKDMGSNYVIDLLLEEGMEKGLQKGLEKGLVQGRQEGARVEACRATLRVLTRRFGAAPDDVRAQLESLSSLERLEGLLDEAVSCADLEAFRAALAGE
jgi:predicted transposase YdaD